VRSGADDERSSAADERSPGSHETVVFRHSPRV
jgi:hypothetical protein